MPPVTKRKKAFSPAQPRKASNKSKATTATMDGSSSAVTKSLSTTKSAHVSRTTNVSKSRAKSHISESRRRSRLVSPTPSDPDSLQDSGDDNRSKFTGQAGGSDGETDAEDMESTRSKPEESPEPDFILAEVSHDPDLSNEISIPIELTHRILHSHFSDPGKTKISGDAREVATKYVEVFVREAIMRCAYEQQSESRVEREGSDTIVNRWLEVDDLEKVAIQLCLDF